MKSSFLLSAAFLVALSTHASSAIPLLYEGFDVTTGTLDGKAGATSFGFDPTLGTEWDSGVFGSPNVALNSISAPGSTSAFYNATPSGNRVVQDFQSTTISRATQVSAPNLYGTFLTSFGLNPDSNTFANIVFTNFNVFAGHAGFFTPSTTWKVQTPVGVVDTGIDGQGTTLVAWEIAFDQGFSTSPDTLMVWFNSNPLTDNPDFQSSTADLGQNDLGGITLVNSIFLGLSTVEYDEFRIGTDWQDVGVVPEPSTGLLMLVGLSLVASRRSKRREA